MNWQKEDKLWFLRIGYNFPMPNFHLLLMSIMPIILIVAVQCKLSGAKYVRSSPKRKLGKPNRRVFKPRGQNFGQI